nr:hypothetical protein [Tanacetum cinerariifolium]
MTLNIAWTIPSNLMLTTIPRARTKWKVRGNFIAPKSIATISHDKREELRKKVFKSMSKLFFIKYLSLASIKELNKNPSALKRVHFVNSVVILSKDIDTEEDVSSTNACRRNLDKMMRGNEEVKEEGNDEDDIETNVKVKEEEEDEDDENFNLFPTMKELSHHEWEMVFGRPLIDETGLVYNKEEGTVMFIEDNEKIKFKMLHTMEIFKQTRLMGASINSTARSPM